MIIFLTSNGYKTMSLLTPYLPKKPSQMNVAFIATAADLYKEAPWVEMDRNKLTELGFNVTDIDIKKFSKEGLKKELENFNIIFVTGGTTTYLLQKSRESGFFTTVSALVKKGTVYVGSSAGSVLVGPDVEVDKIYDYRNLGPELKSYKGIGLVDFIVLPHADSEKYGKIIKEIYAKFGNKFKLKKLNNNQAILVMNGKESLLQAN